MLHVGQVSVPQPRRGQRRPSNWDRDPLLTGSDWAAVKAYWRRERGPCARCGREIDYDTVPRYWRSLDVGHIVGRDEAKARGWTRAQINAVSNTQPEHQRCSREAGVRAGNAKRRMRSVPRRPVEADEW